MVRCSSPTCAKAVPHTAAYAVRWLRWAVERQAGDDRLMPYCPRCRV